MAIAKRKQASKGNFEESEADNTFGSIEDQDLTYHEPEDESIDIFENETPAEKRIRLAKEYLGSMKREINDNGFDAEEIDKELIASRLRDDVLESEGKLVKELAGNYDWDSFSVLKRHRGHNRSITACVVSENEKYAYSASKDNLIIKWDIKNWKMVDKYLMPVCTGKKRVGHVICLAISYDGKYLCSGGMGNCLHVFNVSGDKIELVKCFKQHRKPVQCMAFRKGTNQLFSGSADRTIKVWNIDELSYVETLFGHQDSVVSVDSINKERCVSVGFRDRSLRLWKIVEESQLLFKASGAQGDTLDVVRMIDEEYFLTGSSGGCISIYNVSKKKAIFFRDHCHKTGIISISNIRYSDIFISGASDGFIKVWKLTKSPQYSFEKISEIEMNGFVNSLSLLSDCIIVGLGQEHRHGRWEVNKKVKNMVLAVGVPENAESSSEIEDSDEITDDEVSDTHPESIDEDCKDSSESDDDEIDESIDE